MFSFLKRDKDGNIYDFFVDYLEKSHAVTELALEVAVGKIADVIAKCGFMVLAGKDDQEAKDLVYLLNVKPNPNQNAVDFWKQAVHKMVHDTEGCLIVRVNKGLYIADSFNTDGKITSERKYSNVNIIVDDDVISLNKTFKESDVLRLKYSNPRVVSLLHKVNCGTEELYNAMDAGLAAAVPKVKVTFNGSGKLVDSETGKPIQTNEYAETIAKQISKKEIRSIVSRSGIDVSMIDSKSSLSVSDVKALKEDIFQTTALAFGIPKNILLGDVIQQSNDEFLTYACEPLIAIIDNAMNGTYLSQEEYQKGYRIQVNKLNMKHVDVITSADKLDKLYQNGWSHNDVMKLLGLPRVNEPWADERRFTKNYETKGGENNE